MKTMKPAPDESLSILSNEALIKMVNSLIIGGRKTVLAVLLHPGRRSSNEWTGS